MFLNLMSLLSVSAARAPRHVQCDQCDTLYTGELTLPRCRLLQIGVGGATLEPHAEGAVCEHTQFAHGICEYSARMAQP